MLEGSAEREDKTVAYHEKDAGRVGLARHNRTICIQTLNLYRYRGARTRRSERLGINR
jgi:hypothetical protein